MKTGNPGKCNLIPHFDTFCSLHPEVCKSDANITDPATHVWPAYKCLGGYEDDGDGGCMACVSSHEKDDNGFCVLKPEEPVLKPEEPVLKPEEPVQKPEESSRKRRSTPPASAACPSDCGHVDANGGCWYCCDAGYYWDNWMKTGNPGKCNLIPHFDTFCSLHPEVCKSDANITDPATHVWPAYKCLSGYEDDGDGGCLACVSSHEKDDNGFCVLKPEEPAQKPEEPSRRRRSTPPAGGCIACLSSHEKDDNGFCVLKPEEPVLKPEEPDQKPEEPAQKPEEPSRKRRSTPPITPPPQYVPPPPRYAPPPPRQYAPPPPVYRPGPLPYHPGPLGGIDPMTLLLLSGGLGGDSGEDGISKLLLLSQLGGLGGGVGGVNPLLFSLLKKKKCVEPEPDCVVPNNPRGELCGDKFCYRKCCVCYGGNNEE